MTTIIEAIKEAIENCRPFGLVDINGDKIARGIDKALALVEQLESGIVKSNQHSANQSPSDSDYWAGRTRASYEILNMEAKDVE